MAIVGRAQPSDPSRYPPPYPRPSHPRRSARGIRRGPVANPLTGSYSGEDFTSEMLAVNQDRVRVADPAVSQPTCAVCPPNPTSILLRS